MPVHLTAQKFSNGNGTELPENCRKRASDLLVQSCKLRSRVRVYVSDRMKKEGEVKAAKGGESIGDEWLQGQ